jgi:hypothetical protein
MRTGHSGPSERARDDRKDLGVSGCGLIGWNVTACVSQSTYNKQSAQLQAVQAQVEAQRGQIAKMQSENRWVVAGDLLFPEGGYQLGPDSEAISSQYVPRLRSLQNIKIAVYGFTDNLPVGPVLKRMGVSNKIDLVAASRQRCRVFRSQAVNPISCRPKDSAKRVR